LWWALPVAPRAVMQVLEGFELLGFGPKGQTALVQERGSLVNGDRAFLNLLEVSSGKTLATLQEKYANVAGHSADGRIWVFHRDDTFFKLDLTHKAFQRLSIGPSKGDFCHAWTGVTADGRLLLFVENGVSDRTTAWDLEHDRRRGEILGTAWTDGFDENGRAAIVRWKENPFVLSLVDPITLNDRATMTIPNEGQWNNLGGNWNNPRFGGGFLITNYFELRVYTFDTGDCRYVLPRSLGYEISPDGSILASDASAADNYLGALFSRIGMGSVFSFGRDWAVHLFRTENGDRLGAVFGSGLLWLPGEPAVATYDNDNSSVWRIWDIPPRKSLSWFAAGAALLALPIALLAWRRTRRLRAA
jgi:hypothetical protein